MTYAGDRFDETQFANRMLNESRVGYLIIVFSSITRSHVHFILLYIPFTKLHSSISYIPSKQSLDV